MSSTYTSQWFSVSDGQTTTHNPQSLVGTSRKIDIISATIRWEGVTAQVTNTTYSSNSVTDSDSGSSSTTTESNTNSDSASAQSLQTSSSTNTGSGDSGASASYPSVGNDENASFDSHSVTHSVSNFTAGTITVDITYDDADGNTSTTTVTLSESETWTHNSSTSSNYVGQTRSVSEDSGNSDVTCETDATTTWTHYDDATASTTYPDVPFGTDFDHHEHREWRDGSLVTNQTYSTNMVGQSESITTTSAGESVSVELKTVGTDTTESRGYVSVDYPSVPSGYTFDRHHQEEWEDGVKQIDQYHYTNMVGETEDRTSDYGDGETVQITLTTRGSDSTTTTEKTKNPEVTGDVSGSAGTVTLNDGEQTAWQTLSGLAPNVDNDFFHNIDGSGEAKFQFEFEWEYRFPASDGGELSIYDGDANVIHRVALADPTDSILEYDAFRVGVGGTTYAVDMVKPSHQYAVESHRIYHGTHGDLCPRSKATETP